MKIRTAISFVAAANDQEVLERNLLASPVMRRGHQLLLRRGFPAAGLAYNDAMREARHDLLAFVHQDVFLPEGWDEALLGALGGLEAGGVRWGALGCFGVSLQGSHVGWLYTNGMGRLLGSPGSAVEVQSLDEVVIVLRRSSGLSFDPRLPGFHLYGTDICLQARAQGRRCFAVSAFCFHNSLPILGLPPAFWRSAEYLRRKWKSALPVTAPCAVLEPGRLGQLRRRAASRLGLLLEYPRRARRATRDPEPAAAAQRLRAGARA